MSNTLAKKIFAVGLAASTVLMGLAPLAAQAAAHAAGTNVMSSDGTVWMIMPDGTRRAYTSAGAFLSYGFNSWSTVVQANADDLALPAGSFIPPQDGSIICSDRGSDKGTCYLISGGQKAGFTSAAVFTGRGFSFANAQSGDVSWMQAYPSLISDTTAANLPGVLVNNNGTVQLVGNGGLLGIPDLATFNGWGYSFTKVVPANAADKAMTQTGVMATRTPGQLSPTALAGTPGTPSPTPGSISVSLASGNAPAGTVPLGATNVPFLKFNVTNGSGNAATINQVTVKRIGAGSTSDLQNVYLYQGSSRLTSGRSINSSSNEAVFSGLNVSVPAYGSVTLDVLADINTSGTGNVNQLSVTSVMLGTTQANGTASGNSMTLAGVTAGGITVAKTGSITNPKVGQQNVRIGSFTLAASSAEDLTVKRISLYQAGAVARANFSNFKLVQAGNTISTVSALDSKDHANFDVNFALAKGDTKTFEVYADIGGTARTGSSETVKLYVEENTDLFAVGNTYGYGAAVTKTNYDGDSCTSASGDCSYSYVEGGQLTITFNGPSAHDIAKNGKDVELFNFTMAAQNSLEIRQMAFVFNNGGSGTADFLDGSNNPLYTDIKVSDATTGAVVWGPQDFNTTGGNSATSQTLTFTEDLNMAAGTSKTFKVTADVANNSDVGSGEVIAATLDIDSLTSNDVKNVDNNTFLTSTDIVPTGDISGNQMTVKIPSLESALAATPTSKSFVKGTSNVDAAGFVLTASTAADVRVTDITLTGYIASSTNDTMHAGSTTNNSGTTIYLSDDVVTVALYDGSTQIGQTKSPNTSGVATFTGLNWVIPKGTSKTLTVKMTLSNSANSNNILKWALAAGAITAVDPDGNEVVDTSGSTTTKPDTALNANSSVTTGTAITITGAGTLTVASAGTETDVTDARIVTAGKSGVTLGKIRLTAVNEELKLTKARINVASASAAGAANIADDVTALYLYDGATQIAGPVSLTPSGTTEGYADFTSVSPDFVIGKDGNKVLTVKADLNTISAGADSGDEFAVWLDGTNNFEARGTAGSTVLTAPTSGSYVGNYVVLRKSQPKLETVSMSAALANGTITLYRFKVTAIDNDVALKHFTFTVSTTTGINLSTFTLSPTGGTALTTTDSESFASGAVTVNMTINSEYVVTSGTSVTFDLKAAVTGADTGDSITTAIANTSNTAAVTGDLANQTAAATTLQDKDDTNDVGNDQNSTDTTPSFVWSDMSATSHNDTASGTDDWTNGRYVRNLPTDSQGLSLN